MKMFLKEALQVMALSLLMPCVPIWAQSACSTNPPLSEPLKGLQGTWKGVLVGQESAGQVTITFTGKSLRFLGLNTNEWYEATFTLPSATYPQQLRATITACQNTKDIGTTVGAILKIEDGNLTLVGIQDRDQDPPKSFGEEKSLLGNADTTFKLSESVPVFADAPPTFEDNEMFRYKLRKVQPKTKNAEVCASK